MNMQALVALSGGATVAIIIGAAIVLLIIITRLLRPAFERTVPHVKLRAPTTSSPLTATLQSSPTTSAR